MNIRKMKKYIKKYGIYPIMDICILLTYEEYPVFNMITFIKGSATMASITEVTFNTSIIFLLLRILFEQYL